MMEVYNDNVVGIDGLMVGRIDKDSYQMLSGVKGKTTFFTASGDPKKTGFDVPHEIDVPLYVPLVPGSVSDWMVNPAFEAAARRIVWPPQTVH
jgi:hypothetical protein